MYIIINIDYNVRHIRSFQYPTLHFIGVIMQKKRLQLMKIIIAHLAIANSQANVVTGMRNVYEFIERKIRHLPP